MVAVRPTCGVTFGTVVATVLVGRGGSARIEGCGSTSMRTLTELAHSKVMARSKRQMALNVTRVRRESLAILGCELGLNLVAEGKHSSMGIYTLSMERFMSENIEVELIQWSCCTQNVLGFKRSRPVLGK